MKRIALSLLLLVMIAPLARSQETPPAERTMEIHLHALSRGYMRPLGATVDRVAAMPGFRNVETLGFAGDVLRLKAVTTLSDDAIATAFQLRKVGGSNLRLILAAGTSDRVKRAEARALILDIARAISYHPRPDWGRVGKALLAEASGLSAQLKILGIDNSAADGEFYKAKDYHIEEDYDRYSATYRIWAGAEWTPMFMDENFGFTRRRRGGQNKPEPQDPRFVGLQITRSAWQEETRWVDKDGAGMNAFSTTRAATDSNGKLKVQGGAEWMTSILRRAVAHRLNSPKANLEELPRGRGWSIFNGLDANELQRWDESTGYNNDCLELSWEERASDKHVVATLVAYHEGHPFYLHAEVDADLVREDYAKRGDKTGEVKDAELGTALVWVVGPESGPEVFAERKREAAQAMKDLLAALGRRPADQPADDFAGPLTEDMLKRLGAKLEFKHFKSTDYVVTRQAFGDVEISVGSPMTGGRWWLLGNPATGTILRSDH